MKANSYKRDGRRVLRDGKEYAVANSEVAAATIVNALLFADGRIKEIANAAS